MSQEAKHTPHWSLGINYGPEGEQNYANVYDAAERLVGNLRIHHANAVVTAVNSYASSRAEIARLREALEKVIREDDTGPMTYEDRQVGIYTMSQAIGRSEGRFAAIARAALSEGK